MPASQVRPATLMLLGMLVAACSEEQDPLIPSDPIPQPPPPGLVLSDADQTTGVVYVSAVPGTFNGASHILVHNRNNPSQRLTIVTLEGGFDPVPVEAATGDELAVSVERTSALSQLIHVTVPAVRAPRVIRTDPEPNRIDVDPSTQIRIVFSEPVDPVSLPAGIQLMQHETPVPGSITVLPDSPFSARFRPAQPLAPLKQYEIRVTPEVYDLDHDVLEEEVRIGFMTESNAADLVVSNVTTGAAFDVDGYRVTVTTGDQTIIAELDLGAADTLRGLPAGEAVVTLDDLAVNCSIDGAPSRTVTLVQRKVALAEFRATCEPLPPEADVELVFVRDSALWAIAADGTGAHQLAGNVIAAWPISSPDGDRIAFERYEVCDWDDSRCPSIAIMNRDGTNEVRLGWGDMPSWSPDGGRITFVSDNGGIAWVKAEGGSAEPLVWGGQLAMPAWSPDGTTIAFLMGRGGGWELWTTRPDGTDQRQRRWLGTEQPWGRLIWSPDGSSLLYLDTQRSLWRVSADGTTAEKVLQLNPDYSWTLSDSWPEANLLALTRGSGSRTDVYLVDLETGGLSRLTADGKSTTPGFLR